MKNIILILVIIIGIEFNLSWNGFENIPNKVIATNQNSQKVILQETRERVDGIWYWNLYENGKLLTFLNFWTI
jgi:hypothetical protein